MAERFWTRAGVKGALVRDPCLLLLRRRDDLDVWPGAWDLPGGGVENDRTLEEALVREVYEETGLAVKVGRVLDISLQRVPVRGEPSFPSILSCFLCAPEPRKAPRLDRSEHSEFAWVRRPEYEELTVVPYLVPAIDKALRTAERRR